MYNFPITDEASRGLGPVRHPSWTVVCPAVRPVCCLFCLDVAHPTIATSSSRRALAGARGRRRPSLPRTSAAGPAPPPALIEHWGQPDLIGGPASCLVSASAEAIVSLPHTRGKQPGRAHRMLVVHGDCASRVGSPCGHISAAGFAEDHQEGVAVQRRVAQHLPGTGLAKVGVDGTLGRNGAEFSAEFRRSHWGGLLGHRAHVPNPSCAQLANRCCSFGRPAWG